MPIIRFIFVCCASIVTCPHILMFKKVFHPQSEEASLEMSRPLAHHVQCVGGLANGRPIESFRHQALIGTSDKLIIYRASKAQYGKYLKQLTILW